MSMMLSFVRRHWLAALALFVALGGTSYAAVKLPANSVGTKQIKNGAVTKAKLASGVAVSGPQGPAGAAGSKGDAGPKGDPGAKGDAGANGTSGVNGTNGTNGTDGQDGLNGAALVSQTRCVGCPVAPTGAGARQIQVSDNQWTQGVNEADQVDMEIAWTPPAHSATCSGPGFGGQLAVKLDGQSSPMYQQQAMEGSAQQLFTGQMHVFAPLNNAVPHTLTVEVQTNCANSDAVSVQSVKMDVAAFMAQP